jgi:hypothetical protein
MKRPSKTGPLQLRLVHRVNAGEAVGIGAIPGHLAEPLWRWPGETLNQLMYRASQIATGNGVVLGRLLYPGDTPGCGSSRGVRGAGNSDRFLAVADDSPKGVK